MGEVVKVENLSYKYPLSPDFVLKNINLRIDKGEFVTIMGRSGGGKSTFCYSLCGLVPQYFGGEMEGKVKILGYNTRKTPLKELATKVGIVFQDPESQIVTMNVWEEVIFGPENLGLSKNEIEKRACKALELVGLNDCSDCCVFELSTGQKQRLAIAAVLTMGSDILILDEPTADIDPVEAEKIYDVLNGLRKQGKTVIVVEHDSNKVAEHADRILFVDNGRIIADEEPRDIFPKKEWLDKLGVWQPEASEIAYYLSEMGYSFSPFPITLSEIKWQLKKLRVRFKLAREENSLVPSNAMIKAENLWFWYDKSPVLQGINLEVKRGEFTAIIGRNGSGKTTLVKHFNGLLKPKKGKVYVNGIDTAKTSVEDLAKIVGLIFQNPRYQLFSDNVTEEIAFGPKQLKLKNVKDLVKKTLKIVELEDKAESSPFTLSVGEKERLAVATVLAFNPEIIVLDEPTTGQDRERCLNLMGLLRKLNEEGKTILMVTHDMRIVAEYARRVIALKDGIVCFDGNPRTLFLNENFLSSVGIKPPNTAILSKTFGTNVIHPKEYAYCVRA